MVAATAVAVAVSPAACSGADQPVPSATAPILVVRSHGGLCPDGRECARSVTFYGDGSWRSGSERGRLPPPVAESLRDAATSTSAHDITDGRFTGTCPTAYDGSEVVYTFPLDGGTQVASCTWTIDGRHRLVQAASAAMREVDRSG